MTFKLKTMEIDNNNTFDNNGHGNDFIADVSSSNGFTRHSTCCNEEVTVIGEVTKYYQCNYCKQPCDTEMLEDEKN